METSSLFLYIKNKIKEFEYEFKKIFNNRP